MSHEINLLGMSIQIITSDSFPVDSDGHRCIAVADLEHRRITVGRRATPEEAAFAVGEALSRLAAGWRVRMVPVIGTVS
jgi:hypothetical protein